MTGQDIIDKFYFLVDDETISSTRALELLNSAYDILNTKRTWNYLYATHTSNTIAANDTTYSLPTDFIYPIGAYLLDSSGNYSGLKSVSYKNRLSKNLVAGYYYIDKKNSNLVLTYANPADVGKTLVIDYQYNPAQLAVGTSPVFDRAFHPFLAYEMAKNYWFNDQSTKERAWNREMQAEYDRMYQDMIHWDSALDTGSSDNLLDDTKDWLPL